MPKSKKSKVISLTKVKKRPKDAKDKLIEEIRENCGKYANVLLVSIENERNAFLQEVRRKLRPGRLVCAKNKVMQLALGLTKAVECEDGIHKLAQCIAGQCGLLFTDKSLADVQALFASYQPKDYARAGAPAIETVVLSKGPDALARLPHSIEAHLRALGLPTQLREGKVHLLGDYTVCKENDDLTSDAAQVLKLLEHKHAKFRWPSRRSGRKMAPSMT